MVAYEKNKNKADALYMSTTIYNIYINSHKLHVNFNEKH